MTFIPINNINVFLYKNKLFFAANSGVITINLSCFINSLSVVLYKDIIELKTLVKSPKADSLKTLLLDEINHKLDILNNVLRKKLILKSINY